MNITASFHETYLNAKIWVLANCDWMSSRYVKVKREKEQPAEQLAQERRVVSGSYEDMVS